MILKKFKASGFRSLVEPGWAEFKNMTVFAGENDGGKTALIDALNLFLTNKIPDDDDYTSFGEGDQIFDTMELEAVFELSTFEKEIASKTFPSAIDTELTIFKRISKEQGAEPRKIKTKVHSDSRYNVNFDRLTIPQLKELAKDAHLDFRSDIHKPEFVAKLTKWRRGQPLLEGTMELPQEFVNRLPILETFVSAQALDPEQEINSVLRSTFQKEIESDKYSGQINEITDKVKEELRKDVEKLKPFIEKYCSEVMEVDIEPQFNFQSGFSTSHLQLKKGGGAPIWLEKGGEGKKRLVTLAVYEWDLKLKEATQDENARQMILAFDEPDSHFDYNYQRKIFEIISKLAEIPNIQVVVLTHSLNLIDRVDIRNINHFCLQDQKETKIERLTTEDPETIDLFMYNLSENMGLKNCIMLNERCFLIVEGATEFNALPILFRKRYGKNLQEAGIRLLNGEGNIGALLFAKFLKNNKRRVVFLIDTDSKTAGSDKRKFTEDSLQAAGFDIDNEVFFIGPHEFEDAFGDELWARTANEYWPKSDGSAWTLEDFQGLRTQPKFSRAVKQKVEHLHGPISKDDLGKVAYSISDPAEIPEKLIECFEEASQLAE